MKNISRKIHLKITHSCLVERILERFREDDSLDAELLVLRVRADIVWPANHQVGDLLWGGVWNNSLNE